MASSDRPAPPPPASNEGTLRVIGAPRVSFRDFYHAYLRAPWWSALAVIVVGYLGLNALFGLAYTWVGGIANARARSFVDGFYFSVQTMGTIGYGAMYPVSHVANALVVCESVTGLVVTAVATGLVFSKFAQTRARVVFGSVATIAPMNGVPTLMIRLGNERGNTIVDTVIRVTMVRTERTQEGVVFYRMYDLTLARDRAPALNRSWTALHPITATSPLAGHSPATFREQEVELMVSVSGIDDTSLQPMHAIRNYVDREIVWGARPADILREADDGVIEVDVRKFDEVIATEPTESFPYPAGR